MLTLEQAINDLMDASMTIAEVAESESDEANRINAQNVADDCKQIAELLKELKERRKAPEIVRCGECVNFAERDFCKVAGHNVHRKSNCMQVFGAERRTE